MTIHVGVNAAIQLLTLGRMPGAVFRTDYLLGMGVPAATATAAVRRYWVGRP